VLQDTDIGTGQYGARRQNPTDCDRLVFRGVEHKGMSFTGRGFCCLCEANQRVGRAFNFAG
jgi:hypothetical protein